MSEVSVIIPVYNGGRFLEETLAAVRAQTLQAKEVIAVDDGSADNSWEILERTPWVKRFSRPRHGANNNRIFGIEQSSSQYIVLLDQDDLWHPQHLQILAGLLEKHPRVPLAFTRSGPYSEKKRPSFDLSSHKFRQIDFWKNAPSMPFDCPSVALIRTSGLDKIGGLSSEFEGVSDFHLWGRLSSDAEFIKSDAKTAARYQSKISYSNTLRSKKPLYYLNNLIRAFESISEERIKKNPGESTSRTAQLQMWQEFAALFQHEGQLSRTTLEQAFKRIDTLCGNVSSKQCYYVFEATIWHLKSCLTNQEAPIRHQYLDLFFNSILPDFPRAKLPLMIALALGLEKPILKEAATLSSPRKDAKRILQIKAVLNWWKSHTKNFRR